MPKRRAPRSRTKTAPRVIERRALVRRPPEQLEAAGDRVPQPPLIVGEGDLPFEALLAAHYQHEDDPVAAIVAFLRAHEAGYFPPRPVLEWLAAGFDAYVEAGGKRSLDECLGVTRGPGETPWAKRRLIAVRDELAMIDVRRLVHYGATITAAAELVAARFKDERWDQTGWKLKAPDADTLAVLYSKKWKRQLAGLALERFWRGTPEEISEFLARFPAGPSRHTVAQQIDSA